MAEFESRDQIEERYRWNLESMFASDADFLAALEEAQAFPAQIAGYAGKIAQSPEALLEMLKLSDEHDVAFGKLVNYVQRRGDEDTRNATYQDYEARAMMLYTQYAQASAWITPELLTLDDETMDLYSSYWKQVKAS